MMKEERPPPNGFLLFRKELSTFSENVSIVGFRYICQGNINLFRRLFWTLLVLSGAVFMIYQIKGRIQYYLSNPISVSIRFNQRSPIQFPTVTVCSENRMTKSALDKIGMRRTLEAVYPPWDDIEYQPDVDLDDLYELHLNYSRHDLEHFLADTSFFHHCLFDEAKCAFDRFISTALGLCIQFNSDGSWTLSRAGLKYGLQLVLFANDSDYAVINGMGRGVRMLVHDKDEFPDIENRGIYMSAGFTQNFPLTVRNITSLDEPYVNCIKQEGYVMSMCIAKCKATYYVNTCHCCVHYLPCDGLAFKKNCSFYDQVTCLEHATARWYHEGLKSQCNCRQQCDYTDYPYSHHQTIMSDKFARFLTKNILEVPMTQAEAQKGFALVNLYLSELKVEEIHTTSAYSALSLLCDIGGALGLILGSTILTVFEFSDFVVTTAWKCELFRKRSNI